MRSIGVESGLRSANTGWSLVRPGRLAVWTVGLAWLATGAQAFAQSRLEQLEEELKARLRASGVGRPAAPAPVAPAPVEDAGYLGVVADDRNETGGVRVLEVYEGGPGADAGLRKNDLLTALNGRPLTSMQQLTDVVNTSAAGQQLTFEVLRDGKSVQRMVTLGQRPAPGQRRFDEFGRIPEAANGANAAGARRAMLGVRSQGLKEEDRTRLRLPSTMGALVLTVSPDSPAAEAGLAPDDVIVAIDGYVVNRPSDLTETIQQLGAGKDVLISYYRAGRFSRSRALLSGAPGAPAVAAQGNVAEQGNIDELPMPLDVNRVEVNRPVQPAAPANAASSQEAQRIEQLEAIVGELLNRVDSLERELQTEREKNGAAPPKAAPAPASPSSSNGPPEGPALPTAST